MDATWYDTVVCVHDVLRAVLPAIRSTALLGPAAPAAPAAPEAAAAASPTVPAAAAAAAAAGPAGACPST